MAILMKMGLGGEGLQAYDTETGKYSDEISFSIGGETITSFDDYVRNCVQRGKTSSSKLGRKPYSELFSDPRTKEAAEKELRETYDDLVVSEADRRNIWLPDESKGDIVQQALDNIEKIITPLLCREINRLYGKSKEQFFDSRYSSYRYDKILSALMETRFGYNRFKPISLEDYNKEMESNPAVNKDKINEPYSRYMGSNGARMCQWIESIPQGSMIPIFRAMHDLNDRKGAFLNFFSRKKDREPIQGKGWTDGGVYFATDQNIRHSSADGGYFRDKSRGMVIKGFFTKDQNLKIATGTSWQGNGGDGYKDTSKNIRRFKYSVYDSSTVRDRIERSLDKNGYIVQNNVSSRQMAGWIINAIAGNDSVAGAILGYDALCGYGNEILILNPNKVRLCSTWEGGE